MPFTVVRVHDVEGLGFRGVRGTCQLRLGFRVDDVKGFWPMMLRV